MELRDISAIFNHIGQIKLKLSEAAGAVLLVELKMRLIAELSRDVQNKLKDKRYWRVKLEQIDGAIEAVFSAKLTQEECEKLRKFRGLRNKLMHGDFVGLMGELHITPTGRQYISINKMNKLAEGDIREALTSIERNHGLSIVRRNAGEISDILDKILKML